MSKNIIFYSFKKWINPIYDVILIFMSKKSFFFPLKNWIGCYK